MPINNKISIITLTYNSQKNLQRTLDSIKSQSYLNIEHIIIDGMSADLTQDIINKYIKSVEYEVKVYKLKPLGIFNALNYGIDKSSGNYIGIAHSDDCFSSTETLAFINSYIGDDVDCIFGNINIVDSKNRIIRKWNNNDIEKRSNYYWQPPHTATFIKKNVYDNYGKYNEAYKISGDFEFFCRLPRSLVNKFIHVDETLVHQEIGGISTSKRYFILKLKEDLEILKTYSNKPYSDLFKKKLLKINQFFS